MRTAGGAPGIDQPPGPDLIFATEVMDLAPGSRVLDLACAWGRTTLELARRGHIATGLDISPELIAIARQRAAAELLDVKFVEGSVRALPPLGLFDAVTEFYDDSVISHEDEADNVAALAGVARLLRAGGRFLFGTGDYPLHMAHYQCASRTDMGHDITEEIVFDPATMVGTSVRVHVFDGGRATYRRVRKHYTPAEVATLLDRAGMRLVDVWCGYRRDLTYGSRPEGMVVLAVRDSRR
jgi:hypothetical protein